MLNGRSQGGRGILLLAENLLNDFLDGINSSLVLLVTLERHLLLHIQSVRFEDTAFFQEISGLHAVETFKDSHLRIFAHFRNRNDLYNARHNTDGIEVLFGRILGIVVFLRKENERALFLVGRFE